MLLTFLCHNLQIVYIPKSGGECIFNFSAKLIWMWLNSRWQSSKGRFIYLKEAFGKK